jgi:DNA modification methylase
LSKSKSYYYDLEAIREQPKPWNKKKMSAPKSGLARLKGTQCQNKKIYRILKGANKRDVWTINTQPFKGAHFAVFPPSLVEPCILAGCPKGGTVLDPFAGSGTTLYVSKWHKRNWVGIELNPNYIKIANKRIGRGLK